jgi:hypothetical protein
MPSIEYNGEEVHVEPPTGREVDSVKQIFKDVLESQATGDGEGVGYEEILKIDEIQDRCKELVAKHTKRFEAAEDLDDLPAPKRREFMKVIMSEVIDDMGFIQDLER